MEAVQGASQQEALAGHLVRILAAHLVRILVEHEGGWED